MPSPKASTSAPTIWLRKLISAAGPIIREVPVSEIY